MATVFSDLKTTLNTWLRDSSNLTFSDPEKTAILTEAVNDPYVYIVDRDTSLTTVANQAVYTMPANYSTIYDLALEINGDGYAHHIPRETYNVINGNLIFEPGAKALPGGKTIHIYGKKKLDANSADFPVKIQNYVLHLAMAAAFEMLKTSLTTRFVKNDITMSEIINSISTHKAEAARLRQDIINQRLVTL